MIRRISIVHKRPEISREEFVSRWTGEHAQVAARLKGLRSYVLYFSSEACTSFDGIALTSFDSRDAAERAFSDPAVSDDLRRTRDQFAASVEVCYLEEHVIVAES